MVFGQEVPSNNRGLDEIGSGMRGGYTLFAAEIDTINRHINTIVVITK